MMKERPARQQGRQALAGVDEVAVLLARLGRATHAEYPLLVSGFIARAWRYSSSFSTAVPAATSFLFWLALVAMVLAAITALRGRSLGILAALALAATPAILRQVPRQYADVPLACYFAGAVLMALLDRPVLAGLFAGLATWTKDEGLLFLLVFLAAMTVFRSKSVPLALIGALPGAILALTFKLVIVKGTPSLVAASVPGAAQRISDLERWGTIATAYCKEFLALGDGWYHPILPLAALAISLRLDCPRRRHINFCVAIVGGLLAGYFAFYVITPTPLKLQLQNSLNRLFVQVWPLVVLAVAAGLNPPAAADPGVTLSNVSCPAAGWCVAVGSYVDASGMFQGLIETLDGLNWTATSLLSNATH